MIWVGMPIVGRKLTRMISKLENLVHPSTEDVFSGRFKLHQHRSRSLRTRSFSEDDYSSSDGSPPGDVPLGHFAVYVGRERQRFVIATECLSHKLFKDLLARSEKEFGFEYSGGLIIPCEVELFERLLWLLNSKDPATQKLDLDEVLNLDAPYPSADAHL
ncbi:hypothetical protein O6H91_04G140200 [Diphasiastrum complanatum]|uniref:Uncharacterized protein n=1 Tax=Diphasiastrum complanatum TaxID=34168 RepID=A0ACC2E2K1_DIPCM|nr:hypothetical protein O6H91_04G140200 [Diphasiastrum complanatum]